MSEKKSKMIREKFENESGFEKADRDKTSYKVSYKKYKKTHKKP